MSWLDGETDVLEKLHGALTEVGLPACETAGEREERKQSAKAFSLHIKPDGLLITETSGGVAAAKPTGCGRETEGEF